MDRDSLLDTIRRLLALGESPNEHEARLALAKAYELAALHNLSLDEVEADEGWEEASGWDGGAVIPFHVHMAASITEVYFFVRLTQVTCFRPRGRTKELTLFGLRENVAIGRHVLTFLVRTFWSQWRATQRPKKDYRHFCLGLAQGLSARLRAERTRAQTQSNGRALVLVDAELDRRYADTKNLSTAQARKMPGDCLSGALAAGRAAGRQIAIHPAVPDKPLRPLLVAEDD